MSSQRRKPPRSFARTVLALLSLSLVALAMAACGSGGSDTTAGTSASTAASTSTSGATGDGGGFGLSPAPAVTALVPDDVKAKGTLNNAIYNDGAPEQFIEDGKLVGIEPDFAEAVSELMGVKFKIIPVGSFDSIIPGLQGGRYDVAFADFGITAEREQVVDFVEQYLLGTSFGVKQGSGKTIESATDLCGIKLGTLAGSYFLDQVKALSDRCTAAGKPAITIQSYPTQSAAVLALANGRTDSYAVSTDQLAYAAQQENAGIEAQPFIYQPIPQGIGLPKGSKIAQALQAAMKELVANGVYDKILTKWGIPNAAIPAEDMLVNPSVQ
jgi:polar amino acid transport system substrate-binding protein